jgi:hypothetical protein
MPGAGRSVLGIVSRRSKRRVTLNTSNAHGLHAGAEAFMKDVEGVREGTTLVEDVVLVRAAVVGPLFKAFAMHRAAKAPIARETPIRWPYHGGVAREVAKQEDTTGAFLGAYPDLMIP